MLGILHYKLKIVSVLLAERAFQSFNMCWAKIQSFQVFIGKIYSVALIRELDYAMFVELVKAVMLVRSKYTPRNNLDMDSFFTYRLY